MRRARLARARDEARRLNVDLGVREPEHIDPIETAKELGIEVTFGKLRFATARVYRLGTKGARIRVSDAIVHPGRRRFSIAHEIGHFVLGHELPKETDEASFLARACERRTTHDEELEREADVFATEHLTPEAMVRPYSEVSPIDLDRVRAISARFTASPVASAIRFVELTSERCAVAYAERGEVKWAKRSRTFSWRIPDRMAVRAPSIASSYFTTGTVDDVARPVPAGTWLPYLDRSIADVEIIEHAEAVPEPAWGGVLSLLWIPEASARRLRAPRT